MRRSCLRMALIALALLAGCGTPAAAPTAPPAATSQPTIDPAARGQTLKVLCSGVDDWCKAMVTAFATQTGITASYERLSSGDALARLREDKAAPTFDVWHAGTADVYIAAKNEQLLQPYVSPTASQIPALLRDSEAEWSGAYVGVLGFCSNKDVLARLGLAAPHSWSDLLDPKLKGQVAMAHPATSGTAYNAVWTQVALNGGNIDAMFDYFTRLKANIATFTKSGAAPAELAAKGEIAVAIVFQHDCVKARENGAAALEVSFATEGTGYEIGGVAIVRGTANEAAAQAYIDWALSTKAQEIPATIKSYQLPTNPAAKIPAGAEAGTAIKQVDFDFAAAAAARTEIIERFTAEIAPAPEK
jgi:iron(III) transport system substrate-binding protein